MSEERKYMIKFKKMRGSLCRSPNRRGLRNRLLLNSCLSGALETRIECGSLSDSGSITSQTSGWIVEFQPRLTGKGRIRSFEAVFRLSSSSFAE